MATKKVPTTSTSSSKESRKGLTIIFAFFIIIAAVYYAPDPDNFHAFHPQPAPALEGVLAPNNRLQKAERVFEDKVEGPEKVMKEPVTGFLFTGGRDGFIIQIDGNKATNFTNTKGKNNGWAPDGKGNLIFADAKGGRLMKISTKDASIEVLADSYQGKKFNFLNDVAIPKDAKKIYLSSSAYSLGYSPSNNVELIFRHPHEGAVFSYDTETKALSLLIEGLDFANGICLSHDESFLLVSDMGSYNIIRFWLKGEKKGTFEIFAENLPGWADNIDRAEAPWDGHYWVAIHTLRNSLLDFAHPYPKLKAVLMWIQSNFPSLIPIHHYGLVLRLDKNGNIVESLHDPTGKVVGPITSANQIDGYLWLGNTEHDWIAKLKL